MPKMTKDQRAYATNRASQIVVNARNAMVAKLPPLPEFPKLSLKDKYDLIKNGKAKLLPFSDINKYTNLLDAFDFATPEMTAYNAARKKRDNELDKINKLFADELQNTLDKIMLADAAEALAALEALEKAINKKAP